VEEGQWRTWRKFNRNANEEYQTVMKPLGYSATEEILKAEVSGNFPGAQLCCLIILN